MTHDNPGGAWRLDDFTIKEAFFIQAEALSMKHDAIVLRVPVGRRDAIVRFDVQSYVSALDDRTLLEIIQDFGQPTPKLMSQDYPPPDFGE
ncbi:MAG: hypothetical protein OXG64_00760 [Chloroflexi bacterium]|nr:hypothetical protein [Chloroflexota bacterium]